MSDEAVTIKEPCFGQIEISRVSSSRAEPLYGSKLKHGNFITLSVCESELTRTLNRDWLHSGKTIIEVWMSENQFATMITSLNIGGGTPCTIARRDGESVPPPEYLNERKIIDAEVRKTAKGVVTDLRAVQARLADLLKPGAKITKGEIAELNRILQKQVQHVEENIPYVLDQFDEAMDKAVTEAKADIEAHMLTSVAKLQALNAPPESNAPYRLELAEGTLG